MLKIKLTTRAIYMAQQAITIHRYMLICLTAREAKAKFTKSKITPRNRMTSANPRTKFYTKQGLWSLFLMCAFPLHFWTLILSFRDFSWVSERTNAWDAVGVISYGLLFTFAESVIIFCVMALLGFLASNKWDENRRIALLSLLIFLLSAWAIYGQAYFVWKLSSPAFVLNWLARSGHPYRYLFGMTLAEVSLTICIPVYFALRSEKFYRLLLDIIDRLSLLTMFYLALDLAGLIIIVIRNI